jgi:hypothetical protein
LEARRRHFVVQWGIETMQLLVVASILPSLILMSRTGACSAFRNCWSNFCRNRVGWMGGGAAFGVNAGVDMIVNAFAQHSILIAISLFLVSVTLRLLLSLRVQGTGMADQSRLEADSFSSG